MKRIALATGAKLPTLNEDDLLLVPPLRELGVTAVPAVWDSPDVCWEEFQGVVVRSCWDYHHRLEEFLGWVVWLERAGIPVWNPPAVLRWNSHKGYLRDLAARGVPIVPTRWLGRGEPVDLPMLLEDAGWRDAVMKPAVPADPVYARVDGVERDGHLVLMELELIEPHLFLGWHAGAATRLAASIGALVTRP